MSCEKWVLVEVWSVKFQVRMCDKLARNIDRIDRGGKRERERERANECGCIIKQSIIIKVTHKVKNQQTFSTK